MSGLTMLAMKALLFVASVGASPLADKPAHLKLPVDTSLIRPVTSIPKLTTIPVEDLRGDVNRAASTLKIEPFVGHNSGVATRDEDIFPRFTIGPDNRYQYTDRSYPFRTVGKLVWTNGVFCTAFVMGPRQVVAAKHCIPTSGVGATFFPGIDGNDKPFGQYDITNVITNSYPRDSSSCDWEYDWAVFIVTARVGDTLGWMGLKAPDPAQVGKPILFNLGYPGDKDNGQRPYRQEGITALTQFESNPGYNCDSEPYTPLLSDQDTSGGQSGSPIWEFNQGNRYVWGVTSVASSQNTAYGSGNALVQAVINARNSFP